MRLDVPYIKQFNRSACFPACVEMALKFAGEKVDQKEIYRKAMHVIDDFPGCMEAAVLLAIKDRNVIMEGWIDYKKNIKMPNESIEEFEIYKSGLQKAAKMGLIEPHEHGGIEKIKELVDDGNPVIVDVQIRKWAEMHEINPEYTHNVIVVGYENGGFLCHDPAAHFFGRVGRNLFVTKKKLRESLEAPPYYKNNMGVISCREHKQ